MGHTRQHDVDPSDERRMQTQRKSRGKNLTLAPSPMVTQAAVQQGRYQARVDAWSIGSMHDRPKRQEGVNKVCRQKRNLGQAQSVLGA